jgi:hypothetical protein
VHKFLQHINYLIKNGLQIGALNTVYMLCVFSPQGGNQGLTVVIQGQGQTTGQLQLIPQGVTILPGPGQQLMQAAMPNGTVQRFLFTPLTTTATTASTTTTTVSTATAGRALDSLKMLNVITTCC